jgi:hypothetical protein
MVKTAIYLDNDIALTLRQIATAQRRSQAQIIRDSLVSYITQAWSRPLPPGTGEFDSGCTGLSATRTIDASATRLNAKRSSFQRHCWPK